MPQTNVLNLDFAGWALIVAPDHGAAVLSCEFEGRDILRPAPPDWLTCPDLLKAGHFPLAPYSNRIENGAFRFDGREHQLKWDKIDQQHPLHGTAWQTKWDIIKSAPDHVKLGIRHIGLSEVWPWRFNLTHELRVAKDGLRLSLSLTNEDEKNMPSGLGFHPYFAHSDNAELQFQADEVWLSGQDKLPKKASKLPEDWNFSTAKPFAEIEIDHCFRGLELPASINWPNAGKRVHISGSSNLSHAVVYSNPELNAACFEPVTHMINAVNWLDKDVETGIRILKPGETQTAEIILTVENFKE